MNMLCAAPALPRCQLSGLLVDLTVRLLDIADFDYYSKSAPAHSPALLPWIRRIEAHFKQLARAVQGTRTRRRHARMPSPETAGVSKSIVGGGAAGGAFSWEAIISNWSPATLQFVVQKVFPALVEHTQRAETCVANVLATVKIHADCSDGEVMTAERYACAQHDCAELAGGFPVHMPRYVSSALHFALARLAHLSCSGGEKVREVAMHLVCALDACAATGHTASASSSSSLSRSTPPIAAPLGDEALEAMRTFYSSAPGLFEIAAGLLFPDGASELHPDALTVVRTAAATVARMLCAPDEWDGQDGQAAKWDVLLAAADGVERAQRIGLFDGAVPQHAQVSAPLWSNVEGLLSALQLNTSSAEGARGEDADDGGGVLNGALRLQPDATLCSAALGHAVRAFLGRGSSTASTIAEIVLSSAGEHGYMTALRLVALEERVAERRVVGGPELRCGGGGGDGAVGGGSGRICLAENAVIDEHVIELLVRNSSVALDALKSDLERACAQIDADALSNSNDISRAASELRVLCSLAATNAALARRLMEALRLMPCAAHHALLTVIRIRLHQRSGPASFSRSLIAPGCASRSRHLALCLHPFAHAWLLARCRRPRAQRGS